MTTKTISASRLRSNLAAALDTLSVSDILVVTRRGKSEKAIVDLDLLEDLLAANNPEYIKSITKARADRELFTHEEVFGNLE